MWFDDEKNLNTCSNCKYGNKDISCKACQNCMITFVFSGDKYISWMPLERGIFYDLFIQWNARFRKIFTYCKSYLFYKTLVDF